SCFAFSNSRRVGLDQGPDCKRETMGRHRSFPAGKQHPALRDDAAPAAQDFAQRSSTRPIGDAIAGAARSIAGSGPPPAKAPGSREGVSLAVSVLKQPFQPRAGASDQSLNSSHPQNDQSNEERDETDLHHWKHYIG